MESKAAGTPPTLVVPPQIAMLDGYLLASQNAPRHVNPKSTLLDDFLMIKTDEEVVRYARKWGPLGYCREHGLPNCRRSSKAVCWPEEVRSPSAPIRSERAWREPLAFWHGTISCVNAMRRIGENIRVGKAGLESDWARIMVPEDHSGEPTDALKRRVFAATGVDHFGQPWKGTRSARFRFSFIMQSWLDLGDIRPFFRWENDRWVIRTVPGAGLWPLFGHLVHYLAMSIAGGAQAVFCSFCGREYFPQRRPSAGQRNCCGHQDCKRDYWRENKRVKSAGA